MKDLGVMGTLDPEPSKQVTTDRQSSTILYDSIRSWTYATRSAPVSSFLPQDAPPAQEDFGMALYKICNLWLVTVNQAKHS